MLKETLLNGTQKMIDGQQGRCFRARVTLREISERNISSPLFFEPPFDFFLNCQRAQNKLFFFFSVQLVKINDEQIKQDDEYKRGEKMLPSVLPTPFLV